MCGIIGIVGKNSALSNAAFGQMLATLSKRGPDDEGKITFPSAVLGHTRLSIIDLSGGHQPMKDEISNTAIVFNGEIYNYRELKKNLTECGHNFSTNSDTEVILKAYQEYGEACVQHLDGMFAFALWDDRKQLLFMARDRFGKKPLYYAFDGDKNLFIASEIKALFASGRIKGKIDRTALDNYLALMYIPPWKSVYKNVFQLPPAHYAVFKEGHLRTKRYWHLSFQPISISYDEAKEEVQRLLQEAIKKRMLTSDVEVGALLSGGVDSTIISIFAKEYLDHPLKTFSLGYGEYINELPFAAQAAHAIKSEHHTLQAGGNHIEELEKVLAYFDEPHADSSDFPQHMLSELAASKVKVALSGDGGDELFMGYGWHTRHHHLSYRANPLEKIAQNPFGSRVHSTRVFTPLERALLWKSLIPLNNNIFAKDIYTNDLNAMEKIVMFDLTTYLPGQLLYKIDRTSMMHSLEIRSPFLDTALAEFVCNLPTDFKARKDGSKIILKDLLKKFMPNEFVHRRKQGFGAPVARWLREKEMQKYVTDMLGPQAEIRALFAGNVIDYLFRDFYSSKKRDRAAMRLWILLCLEIWFRKHRTEFTL